MLVLVLGEVVIATMILDRKEYRATSHDTSSDSAVARCHGRTWVMAERGSHIIGQQGVILSRVLRV